MKLAQRLTFSISATFITPFFVMLYLGIAHGFDGRVPAFGYWTLLFVAWAVELPVGIAITGNELSKK